MSDCLRIAELVDRIGRIARGAQFSSGLNPAQWEALRFIARANRYSRSPGALACYLGATRGTVSQTLITLESKGYITRTKCGDDRRAVTIDLTDAGREMIANDPLCLVLRAADGLGCEAQSQLADGLEGLVRAVQEAKDMPEFGPCQSCAYFQPDADGKIEGGSCHCALTDEPILCEETSKICVEFKSQAKV